jgi:hypothetical protein
VFPVYWPEFVEDDVPPICGCGDVCGKDCGKHPIPRNGLHAATNDLAQLHEWNNRYPHANWAVRTGPESGIWVADYDGDEGHNSRRALEAETGGLGNTAQVRTGSGGLHELYLWPQDGETIKNSASKLAPGVDVRGDGGYILLPGSLHRSGKRYEAVDDRKPVHAPAGLLVKIIRGSKPASQRTPEVGDTIIAGGRNTALTSLAGSVRNRGATEAEIYALLSTANANRCKPPLNDCEVRQIARSVARYEVEGNDTSVSGLPGGVDLGELMRKGVEDAPQLVEGLVYEGQTHSVWSAPASGKSLHGLYVCYEVAKQCKNVLYLDQENSYRTQLKRLIAFGFDPAIIGQHWHFRFSPGLTTESDSLTQLQATIEETDPALIVFDSWIGFLALSGRDENSAVDVSSWVNLVCRPLTRDGRAVWILDHTPYDGDHPRGSSAKVGEVDVSFKFRKGEDFNPYKIGTVELIAHKDREAMLPVKQTFRIGGDRGKTICERDEVIHLDGMDLSPNELKAFDSLAGADEPLGFTQWFELSGIGGKSTFSSAIKGLQDKDRIKKVGGKYALPSL